MIEEVKMLLPMPLATIQEQVIQTEYDYKSVQKGVANSLCVF